MDFYGDRECSSYSIVVHAWTRTTPNATSISLSLTVTFPGKHGHDKLIKQQGLLSTHARGAQWFIGLC